MKKFSALVLTGALAYAHQLKNSELPP